MPNTNYIKGRRKEYAIRTKLLQQGWDIVQRTAGSHSPIDIIAIHIKDRTIRLIQAKPDSMNEHQRQKIRYENGKLNGLYNVTFSII